MNTSNFKSNIFLFLLISLFSSITYSQNHLQFDGDDAYITFGNNSALGLSSFTLEAWIYPTGTGASASSGIGGISAIPIITKGRGETGSESTVTDMNYFIGIKPSTMVLSADFEEGASGSQPGENHPITGTTALNLNQWYHVAATYDGNDWYLYIDGNPEGTLSVGEPCQNLSIQHAAVGSALLSTGDPQGYFEGEIDEVRIWDIARTQQEIQDNMNKEITTVVSGLVSAWNMNEGVGTIVNSAGGISGQIINSSWSWVNLNAWNHTYYVSTSGNDGNDGSLATPWLTIQGAIDNTTVSDGDIIIVNDGEYLENVIVTKELTIQSVNGYSSTTVHGPDMYNPVIQITSNNVTIDGFTAYGAIYNISNFNKSASILLSHVSSCTIINNRCGYDINHNSMMGIELSDSGPNLVSNNICSYNLNNGISLGGPSNGNSDGNTVLNNICSYNSDNSTHGIGISISSGSDNNEFRGNIIENNHYHGVLAYNNTNNFGDLDDKGENSIKNNGMYDVYFSPNTSGTTLNAYYNYWGSNDATIINSHIRGAVNFDPWLTKTFYVSKTGNDENDGSESNPWLSIQGAINNSTVNNGDTIIVKDGTYNENVNVTKEIILKSANGYSATTVTAVNSDDKVIEILSDNVTIDGFTAYGAISNGDDIASIHLSSRTNCKILNNCCGVDASNYSYRSIMLRNSDNCLISNNICSYSPWEGILLYEGSDNNQIQKNTCTHNNWGISNTSSNNILRDNVVENNIFYGVNLAGGTADLGASSSDKGGNTFRNNGSYDVYNGTGTATNAYYNYWGTNDATTIASHIYGAVNFDPWLTKTFYVSKTGNDENDGSESNPWLTIQGAIDNPSVDNGDIIIVKDGTYTENVNITKEITLKSENGYTETTVISARSNDSVFEINGINNVTIEGFTAYGATSSWNNCGVKLISANNCTINNNRCGYDASHNNYKGIQLYTNCDNNTISNNICNYCLEAGIQLYSGSDNNVISNNELSNNGGSYEGYGLQTDQNCTSNNLRGNLIENNAYYGIRMQNNASLNLGNNNVNDQGNNTIRNNVHYDISNATANLINAYYNIWGSNDAVTIDSHIYDNEEGGGEVYFNPWIESTFDLQIDLTVLLEGPFNNGEMSTSLLDQSTIPTAQPYSTLPWEYQGTENVDPIPDNIVDWVLVELRTEEEAASMVKQAAGLLDKDGKIVDLDGFSPLKINYYEGDYYIVIYHRNHLPIMTPDLVHLEP